MQKKLFYFLTLVTIGFCLSQCMKKEQTTDETTSNRFEMEPKNIEITDPHTYSNFQDVRVTHLTWNAIVDFENQTIQADAIWKIKNPGKSEKLILDTKNLDIQNVILNETQKADYRLLSGSSLYGKPLEISIKPNTKSVTITYNTTPESEALQWLTPQQTADKTNPFLFTQSQAILARTWLPSMDGPGVRFTYNAEVVVPKGLMALMSADNPKFKNDNGKYQFTMNQPIPSYLFALAVGNLEYESLGEQSGVYSEPSVVKKAAKEFSDLPKMISAAEEMYGPYQWEEYDIIVLPPSFPFGGMENPRLTFATPTILAGDKSLTSLVAHELAHSWSGNLVTNANWEDFWLNEGFTVYFEQRIMEKLYGREYSEMLASLSYQGLQNELQELDEKDTKLHLDLENRNPDDGMTSIAYDKGYLFLRHIEETIGRETFDEFLRSYFDAYQFKVMNTESFIELLNEEIVKGDETLANELRIEEWIHQPGLPENHPVPSSDRFTKIDSLISDLSVDEVKKQSNNWSSHEWQHFIESLPDSISTDQMKALDNAFSFTQSSNSEIQFDWYKLAIEQGYQQAYPAIEDFLVNVGRRKFLTPLYKAMVETDQRDWALDIYEKARPNYHSVSFNTIDETVNWNN